MTIDSILQTKFQQINMEPQFYAIKSYDITIRSSIKLPG